MDSRFHHLAAQQGAQHAQIIVVLRDAQGALPHRAHGRVAGADGEVHASRGEAVQRRDRRHLNGRDARAADRGAGAQTQSRRLPGRQRQHGVAVREQHLAVGHPDRVVPERLGVAEEADLVDVRHDADAEAHGPDLTW